jgi:hypothetical protein
MLTDIIVFMGNIITVFALTNEARDIITAFALTNEARDIITVFALTNLHEARDKLNWILRSEIYERICLNK